MPPVTRLATFVGGTESKAVPLLPRCQRPVQGEPGCVVGLVLAENLLGALIGKYLGNTNRDLAEWLLSRVEEKYAVKITPKSVNAWDFSGRMEK